MGTLNDLSEGVSKRDWACAFFFRHKNRQSMIIVSGHMPHMWPLLWPWGHPSWHLTLTCLCFCCLHLPILPVPSDKSMILKYNGWPWRYFVYFSTMNEGKNKHSNRLNSMMMKISRGLSYTRKTCLPLLCPLLLFHSDIGNIWWLMLHNLTAALLLL